MLNFLVHQQFFMCDTLYYCITVLWLGLFPCGRIAIWNMLIFGLNHPHMIYFDEMTFQRFTGELRFTFFHEMLLLFQGDLFTFNTSPCSFQKVSLSLQKWTIGEMKQFVTADSPLMKSRAWSKVKGPHRSGTHHGIVIQVWDSVHIKRHFMQ